MSRQRFILQIATLCGMAVSGFVVSPTIAQANPINPVVNCTSTGQECNQTARLTFSSDDPGREYAVDLRAPASHCSPIKYFTTNSSGQRVETGVLNPGQQTYLLLGKGFNRGSHTIQIGAIGVQQGCNTGHLGSWGVRAAVYPVPQ